MTQVDASDAWKLGTNEAVVYMHAGPGRCVLPHFHKRPRNVTASMLHVQYKGVVPWFVAPTAPILKRGLHLLFHFIYLSYVCLLSVSPSIVTATRT
jgi:hypothetical protein